MNMAEPAIDKNAAIGYVRLGEQESHGDAPGIAEQRSAIERFCTKRGLTLLNLHVDHGADGDRPAESRPALHAALEQAGRCKAVFVAQSLSRLARSPMAFMRLAQHLHDAGAQLVLIQEQLDTTQSSGTIFFRLIASMGELDHDKFIQHAPFGFDLTDDGARIVVNPGEQEVIRKMVRWQYQNQSAAQIAGLLNEEGVPTTDGRPWDARAVQTVLDHAPTSRWTFEENDRA